jgi:rare lipoprotein A
MEYLGQASLAGSDDNLLLATLRTDGTPAAIPGTSARTMVASNEGGSLSRTPSPDIETETAEAELPQSRPAVQQSQPVVQAYAAPQTRTVQPSAPVMATLASASSTPVATPASLSGTPTKAAPLPPSRPFDLDTIANAGRPVSLAVPTTLRTTLPPVRGSVASLYATPEKGALDKLPARHPFKKVSSQQLETLARD